jgi:hypothetical protein
MDDKGNEMIAQIVSDPARFFYEIKADAEESLPVSSGKSYTFSVELFPTLVPFTYANASLNYNIYKEGKLSTNMPQIDLMFGAQYMFGAKIASNLTDDINDANFWGYDAGLLLSNSFNSRTRTFYGYKHSFVSAKLDLNSDKNYELLGVRINSFDSSFSEDSVIFGVETLKDVNKYWAMQINYGLTNNTLAARISWYGKWFELGFNIYPEGVLVVHPTWSLRLGF